VSAPEQPLERVNYFNGQRLVAADFRTDQEYQISVRRTLTSALYPGGGIVQGLEVTASLTDTHKVVVAPGVAIDFLGREIILTTATEVQASGTPTPQNSPAIFGNYVVISYAEQRGQAITDGCAAPAGKCGGNLTWGAATRILQAPQLAFADTYPSPTSGLIILAQVELQAGCTVGHIESGVRTYAVAAKPPTTRPISLEGEKDIDQRNPKTLYFHIDGGVPSNVTLYLRAAQFSSLYYTELGGHTHNNSLTNSHITVPAHHHTLTGLTTGDADQDGSKPAGLSASSWNDDTNKSVRLWGGGDDHRQRLDLTQIQGGDGQSMVILTNFSAHTHKLPNSQTDDNQAVDIPLGSITNAPAGVASPPARATGSTALGYVNNLRVLYDRQDITIAIVQFVAANNAAWAGAPAQLGDGTPTSPLVAKTDNSGGTGAIPLNQLSVALDFSPGQHSLTFEVTDSSGGQIQYNLYVG
jgi:hypothetical protein